MTNRFVVGIGTQKAATSSLANFLSQNGVAIHPKKEAHAFYSPQRELSREEYLAHFPSLPADGWFGEFSPEYCMYAHALLNINRMFPDAKVVFSYRNPISRLQSAYQHATADRRMSRDISLDKAIDLAFRGHQNHWVENLLRYGQYDVMLRTVEKVFDRQSVYVVRHEDLGTVAEKDALNGLLRMLELDELPANAAAIERHNSSEFHAEKMAYKADTSISEINLERLMEFYAPIQRAMQANGYRTEWF